ncbi:MAG: alpha/beta hydrolase [Chloroflexota bacterium]|nr:alpha/beta hydrolase [Chloroflexota bacterium]MDE2682730.1 alpha/beta hydrolase [Chloroflexota bacterium]
MVTTEAIWEVPEPLSTSEVRVDDDAVITVRQHGNPSGQRLILSHGNGLAIDLYYPFWSLLLEDFELIVYDLRNHGWNPVSVLENHTLPTFVEDHDKILAAIDRDYGSKPKIGVFHSISALASLLSANKGSDFAARVLFDPPLCKPGRGYVEFEEAAERVSAMTRRRTPRFETREELASVLPLLPLFQNAVPGVADLFTRTTLRESDTGEGYVLRCPREYEAQIVQYASTFAVLVDFDSVLCPTKVIGADPTLPFSFLPSLDLSDAITVGYDFLPNATHLLQLEQPKECVELMREFLESVTG